MLATPDAMTLAVAWRARTDLDHFLRAFVSKPGRKQRDGITCLLLLLHGEGVGGRAQTDPTVARCSRGPPSPDRLPCNSRLRTSPSPPAAHLPPSPGTVAPSVLSSPFASSSALTRLISTLVFRALHRPIPLSFACIL
jgi:hypothetical protein